jgi:hypothetical protein
MGVIKKVLANVAQSLTDDEKCQARQNIGAGTGDAGIQKIQFTLNTSPYSNPTSVTCDIPYSDIATRWGFNNVLPVAYLSWAGSGNDRIWCTRFDTDVASAELRFTFCTSDGITVLITYKSNGTLTVSVSYLRVHRNYEEYMILQASDGTFSRNFSFSDLNAVLNNRYRKTIMNSLEFPHILLSYNADANPGKEDELVKLDFVKAIRNSNNTTKGYQFSCIHRAEFGTGNEANRLVTYTIFSDNTDAVNIYDLT